MNLSGRQFKALIIAALVAAVVVIWKVVTFFGVINVLAFLYLLIGAMVAFETRESSGHGIEVVLVVPFWLPMIVYGIAKKLYQGRKLVSKEITDEVADE